MNHSTKPIILGILLALISVLGIVYLKSAKTTATALSSAINTEPLQELNVATIKAVSITGKDAELNLQQVGDQWQLVERGNYPADESTVQRLITNVRNMKVLRAVTATKQQLTQLGLEETEGVFVELKDKAGKVIHKLQLGKEIAGPPEAIQTSMSIEDRRFVMVDGKADNIVVVDQTFDSTKRVPKDWLNKDFFEIKNPTSVAVTFPGDSNSSWSINQWDDNGTKKWRVTDVNATAQPPENNLPTGPFSSPSFDDVADAKQAAQLDNNATRIEVGTADGFQYTLTVKNRLIQGDYMLKVDVNATITATDADRKKELTEKLNQEQALNRVYFVPAHVVESVTKTRADLFKVDPPNPGPGPGGGSPFIPPLNGFPPRPN